MSDKPINPRLLRVSPVGTRSATGFWDGRDPKTGQSIGGFGTREMPNYPDSPRGKVLGEKRRARMLGLRDCARIAGLTAEEFSGLEHGRYTFADETEWERVIDAMGEMRR